MFLSAMALQRAVVCNAKTISPQDFLADALNCGPLLPDVQMKIVDTQTNKLLATNNEGMICIKSPALFPVYYDARKEPPFLGGEQVFDTDGFYITGDIGKINNKGELYVKGRLHETMTCRGALKVLPNELELALMRHPIVSQACVIGLPNPIQPSSHLPRAFIVLKERVESEFKPMCASTYDSKLLSLQRRGKHNLCSLNAKLRHAIELDSAAQVKANLSYEKQLIGGLIILDSMPQLRQTGKFDKNYLRRLGLDEVEIFGDLPE